MPSVQPWLIVLSDISLSLAILASAFMLSDIVRNRRPMMPIMKWVWPITGLYMGPLAILAYRKFQLARPMHHAMSMGEPHIAPVDRNPSFADTFVSATHCGAGCSLGDLIAEWLVFLFAAGTLAATLKGELAADYVLAYLLGIAFQYFAIAPMRGIHGWPAIREALKADTLTLTAFEIGLFAWMAVFQLVLFHGLHPNSPVYWFMMQIGMVLGFLTSFPVNAWLLRAGIKEPM
jgi:hypothetical protein